MIRLVILLVASFCFNILIAQPIFQKIEPVSFSQVNVIVMFLRP